jgi:hypothetical protein
MKSSRNIFRRFSKSSLTEQLLKFEAASVRKQILTSWANGIAVMVTAVVFGAALFNVTPAQPMPSPEVSREYSSTISGTVTLEMKTASGNVKIILPDDIRPGDTITGTVFAGQGVVEGEVISIKTVEGEVVASKKIGPSSPSQAVTFTVPQGISSLILACNGKHIPAVQFTINANFSGMPAQPGSFAPPRLGQTGRDITIPGNFDGNAANTTVDVGGKALPVIAESPREAVVKIPADMPTGPSNLTVGDGPGNSRTTPFNVASIELKADKLNLIRGEKTDLHVTVTGLEGLKDNSGNIRLQIENASPQTVSLTNPVYQSNGNAGAMPARAVNPDGGNSITFTEQLTGVNPGIFQINATLITPLRNLIRELIRKYWEDQLNAIAALKEAAAKNVKGNSKVPKDLLENAKKLRDLAKEKLWDEKGTALLDLKRSLQKEKDELNRIQKVMGAGSDTGKEIQKIKDALDKMAKGMGITLDK